MASASALAGAFTTLGVSANRAAAKKTNVVAKKVRVRVDDRFRSQREHAHVDVIVSARRAGAAVARAPGDPRGSRVRRDPDRRVIDAARAIARRARLSRTPPIRSGIARLFFFTNQAIGEDARFANLRRLERSLTPPLPRARSAGFLRALGGPLRQA